MTIFELREGAYLELYVLGLLSANEINTVKKALDKNPELYTELLEIEQSLLIYADAHAISPPPELRDSILDKARKESVINNIQNSQSPKAKKANKFKYVSFALLLSTLGLMMTAITRQHRLDVLSYDYDEATTLCNEEKTALKERIFFLEALQENDNSIIKIDPTDKFPETNLYFHTNPKSKKNFIQIQKLPALAANQSFQLWSLKDDSDPIPLNIFRDRKQLIEVDFVDNCNAYAITIEAKGGSKTPNLDNLIGLFAISG